MAILMRAALLTMIAVAAASPLHAQEPDGAAPALLQADEMTQDRELGTVVAKGNVEITQGGRILLADVVSYNQKSNTVTASGNVILMEPNGDTMFAEYVELTDSMRNGVIKEIRILLSDDSRFAANIARRTGGNRTVLTKAVYSPCKVCREEPEKPPLWRLKASTIVHDKAAQEIRYTHARLEMFGVPVAYTPYFSHPDPTIDRKSGLLAPSFGSSGDLGAFLALPYFWAINPNSDATVVPILTRDERLILSGEYRQRFDNGEIDLSGSLTQADRRTGTGTAEAVREDEIRGHLFARGRFDLDDTWRTGFDINRATDRSYLRRFNFFGSPGNSLETNVYLEGFRSRNYAAANVFLFQDLRSGQQPNTPRVAPLIDFNYVGEPTRFGGRFSIDANARSLYRDDAADSQRLSLKLGYELPYTADVGFVTTFRGTFQSDLYYVDQAESSLEDDGFTGRIFPQLSVDWRFPFVRQAGVTQQIVEPIAALVVSPNGSNSSAIPIEDSVVFEIDDTSILSADRFPGIDRVESGQKIIYGLKLGVFGQGDGRTTAFIGQSYRIHEDNDRKQQVGIESNLSDIVGRLEIRPNRYMDLLYRFRADQSTLEFRRNEVGFSAGPEAFRVSGNYIFIDDDPSDAAVEKREELSLSFNTKINDFWSVALRTQRDLSDDGGTLFAGMQVTYEDECFIFETKAERRFTQDADFEPSDKITIRLTFKHLGSLSTGGN